MLAALPHCDALVSGHSLDALGEVAEAIGTERRDRRGSATRHSTVSPPAVVEDEPEPWASATPVPGSSVAMPSGHGPRRGKVTPGWSAEDTSEKR